jgi:carboxylesterase type B
MHVSFSTPFLLSGLVSSIATAKAVVCDEKHNVTYLSTTSYNVESFLNIPFAGNISGEARFSRPTPVNAQDTINGTVPCPACGQVTDPLPAFDWFSNVSQIAEECLNLRVDRPANLTADAKLPVMVYIYVI